MYLTNHQIPLSRFLLENITVPHIIKKFAAPLGIQKKLPPFPTLSQILPDRVSHSILFVEDP
jgi:hypothetical protein